MGEPVPLVRVRQATELDVPYIDKLQREFHRALAFLPRQALEAYIRDQVVSIGLYNDEPAAYLLGTRAVRKDVGFAAIYQAAVDYDARHRMLGTALVEQFVSQLPRTARGVQLWCAQDLEANLFWTACGFEFCGFRPGSDRKKRLVIFWRRALNGTAASALHRFDVRRNPGCKRTREIVTPARDGMTWQNVTLDDCIRPTIITLPSRNVVGETPIVMPEPKKFVVPAGIPQLMCPVGHKPIYSGGKLTFRQIVRH